MGYYVLRGKRPDKPENASTIGFSDSLWDFTERCWDGRMAMRPKVRDLVRHLGEAAANWTGLMPPCVQAKAVGSGTNDLSGLTKRGEFEVLVLP